MIMIIILLFCSNVRRILYTTFLLIINRSSLNSYINISDKHVTPYLNSDPKSKHFSFHLIYSSRLLQIVAIYRHSLAPSLVHAWCILKLQVPNNIILKELNYIIWREYLNESTMYPNPRVPSLTYKEGSLWPVLNHLNHYFDNTSKMSCSPDVPRPYKNPNLGTFIVLSLRSLLPSIYILILTHIQYISNLRLKLSKLKALKTNHKLDQKLPFQIHFFTFL